MLTKKQRDLLVFIHKYTQKTGLSPSFEEMKDGLDLKSKSGIHRLIKALVERGFLERMPNKARALEVKKLPDNMIASPSDNVMPIPKQKQRHVQASSNSAYDNHEEIATIPLHGKIAAGTPIEALSPDYSSINIPMSMLGAQPCYALTIEGDSMSKVGIMDGDIVIVEKCSRANDGDIVVALVDGEEATLKRLRREVGSIVLMPENDSYEPIRLEPNRVEIQGKLRSLFRNY